MRDELRLTNMALGQMIDSVEDKIALLRGAADASGAYLASESYAQDRAPLDYT